jgi:hypothetical protein
VIFIPLTVVRIWITVILKEPFLGWRNNYFLSGASALRDWILCSAWKKWIRNPTTHSSSLWIRCNETNWGFCDFWAFPTLKRELQGKKFRSDQKVRQTVCSTFSRTGWSDVTLSLVIIISHKLIYLLTIVHPQLRTQCRHYEPLLYFCIKNFNFAVSITSNKIWRWSWMVSR